jgi:hypothetical protein
MDADCVLAKIFNNDGLLFPGSIHLTDIRIALYEFEQFICLLNQFGSQLYSFVVNMMSVSVSDGIFAKIKSVCNILLIVNFI